MNGTRRFKNNNLFKNHFIVVFDFLCYSPFESVVVSTNGFAHLESGLSGPHTISGWIVFKPLKTKKRK